MARRIAEIDFFKGVLIQLMIAFHLIYIGDSYPYLKQVVYTFHMPGFLLLSGYLLKQHASTSAFFRSVGWLLVPYAVMETGYVVMSSLVPVREAVDQLTLSLLLQKLLLHPLGPYWYLHTLVLCTLITRLVRGVPSPTWRFVWAMVAVLGCAQGLGLLSAANGCYFLLGGLLRQSGLSARGLLWRSWIALVPLCLLCLFPSALDRSSLGGLLILYLVFSVLLRLYASAPRWICRALECAGRNSLPLFLFSPLFTLLMKFVVPWFAFDPTGLLFLCISLAVASWGSLGIAWAMDRCGLSRYFCGRQLLKTINPIQPAGGQMGHL